MQQDLTQKVRELVLEKASSEEALSEESIARKFGVSRTPVREVLAHLKQEGLLEGTHKKGIKLRDPSLREIIEIYDLRAVLEGLAARLLAPEIDTGTLAELNKLAREYTKVLSSKNPDWGDIQKSDIAFHKKLVQSCGNSRLRKIVNTFHVIVQSVGIKASGNFRKRPQIPHEEIVETLKTRDPAAAEAIVRQHVGVGKMNLIEAALGPGLTSSERL